MNIVENVWKLSILLSKQIRTWCLIGNGCCQIVPNMFDYRRLHCDIRTVALSSKLRIGNLVTVLKVWWYIICVFMTIPFLNKYWHICLFKKKIYKPFSYEKREFLILFSFSHHFRTSEFAVVFIWSLPYGNNIATNMSICRYEGSICSCMLGSAHCEVNCHKSVGHSFHNSCKKKSILYQGVILRVDTKKIKSNKFRGLVMLYQSENGIIMYRLAVERDALSINVQFVIKSWRKNELVCCAANFKDCNTSNNIRATKQWI